MKKENFWNDAARWGACVGLLLVVSSILEHRLFVTGHVGIYAVEWFLALILHYWLLKRAAVSRSRLYKPEEGFLFRQCYGFLLAVSAFAGFLSGLATYLYTHFVIGYGAYIDGMMESTRQLLARSGGASASMEAALAQSFRQIASMPEPSVLSSVWGGIFSSLLFALFFGLFIAGRSSRAPRPFDTQSYE